VRAARMVIDLFETRFIPFISIGYAPIDA
jgi:hypothetical protein